jgi:HEAT repeat protein
MNMTQSFSRVGVAIALTCLGLVGRSTAQQVAAPILSKSAPELVQVLDSDEANVFEKAKACQRLQVIGDKSAVPALAAQLANDKLNVYARTALEAIPGDEAAAALRDAATKLSGRPLVGVLDSLGQMRDAASVELLAEKLKDGDASVRAAAAVALGTIADARSIEALQAALVDSGAEAPGFGEACIKGADSIAHSSPKAALALYDRLLESKAPEHVRLAAALGRSQVSGEDPAKWLAAQLTSAEPGQFNLGLSAARKMGGAETTAALMKLLPSLEPERRALVLRAVGDRSDAPPLEAVVAETASDSPLVRAAAVDVVAKSRRPEAATHLLGIAFSDKPAAPAALEWLKSVRSDAVDEAISRRAASDERASVGLIELIGSRRMGSMAPYLVKRLNSSDAAARRAATTALGQVATLGELDALVERALAADVAEERAAAKEALRTAALRLSERDAAAGRLASELDKAAPENRQYLLALLREMGAGSAAALKAVVKAARSGDAELKEAATKELGEWPTADAADVLLDLAKTDPEDKYRIRAMRGYLRIARQLQLSEEDRLKFYRTAMETAQRDDERRLALDILTRIPNKATLELATERLGDAAVKEAAAEAALKIAAKLIATDKAAVAEGMKKVADAQVGPELTTRAQELATRASAGE